MELFRAPDFHIHGSAVHTGQDTAGTSIWLFDTDFHMAPPAGESGGGSAQLQPRAGSLERRGNYRPARPPARMKCRIITGVEKPKWPDAGYAEDRS